MCGICSKVFVDYMLYEEMKEEQKIKRRHLPVTVSP